ncbi:1-phosphofructokinase [Candidatus Margulisiibacteriota bacterium]
MITTVTLNPALDMTLGVKAFKADDSNRVQWVLKNPGGKGINVSRVVNVLGGLVNTVAFVGGHAGAQLRELLKEEGVILWEVEALEETRTNVTFVVEKDKTQTRLNQKGAKITPKELKSLFNLISQVGDNADFLVISGSLPPNVSKDTYQKIIKLVKSKSDRVRIVLDADGEVLQKGLKARPFLVKPNIHELERLVKDKIKTERDICRAALKVQEMGAANVIVSRGAKGIIALSEYGEYFSAVGPKIKVASTVGAGDSFIAGVIFKLDQKATFKEALAYGVAVSSAMVMTPGTELCRPSDVKKLVRKVKLNTLDI